MTWHLPLVWNQWRAQTSCYEVVILILSTLTWHSMDVADMASWGGVLMWHRPQDNHVAEMVALSSCQLAWHYWHDGYADLVVDWPDKVAWHVTTHDWMTRFESIGFDPCGQIGSTQILGLTRSGSVRSDTCRRTRFWSYPAYWRHSLSGGSWVGFARGLARTDHLDWPDPCWSRKEMYARATCLTVARPDKKKLLIFLRAFGHKGACVWSNFVVSAP